MNISSSVNTVSENLKNNVTTIAEKTIHHDIPYYLGILEWWAIDFLPKLFGAIIILWVGFKIANFFSKIFEKIFVGHGIDPTVEKFVVYLSSLIFKAMVIIAAIGVLGVQTSSFVALIAAAGFAIGTALSGSLSNFASGIIILIFRPYRIGDWVHIAGESGQVTDVTIFATKLKTVDTRSVIIPNAKAISDRVINNSIYPNRRLDLRFSVVYGDDIEKIREELLQMLNNHPKILQDEEFAREMLILGLENNAINIALRAWTPREEYADVQSDILREVHDIFLKNDFHFQVASVRIAS